MAKSNIANMWLSPSRSMVGVGHLDLCHEAVTIQIEPKTIKTDSIVFALIETIFHRVVETTSKFIDNVLKDQTAAFECGACQRV